MTTNLSAVRSWRTARARSAARPSRGDWRLLPIVLGATDAMALALAVSAAGALRLRLDEFVPVVSLGLADHHLVASFLVIPVLLLLFRLRGLYDLDFVLAGTREYAEIASAATYGVLITLVVSYFLGDGPIVSRSWLMLVWAFSMVSTGAGRFLVRRAIRRLRQKGIFRTRVVIVGASSFGIALAEQLRDAHQEGVDIVGFLDEYIPFGQALLDGVPVIGNPSDLTHAPRPDVDEYIFVPQALPHERVEEITHLVVSRGGPRLRMTVSSSQMLTHGVRVAERAGVPLVTLGRARISGVDAILKRALDVAGATLALLVLAPLAAIAYVRATAGGARDVLYGLEIHGACGEHLTLWLFRRALSDSLPVRGVPALLAVLGGHCSLVGPRPVLVDDDLEQPAELTLTAMKPGLTGPWRLGGPHATLAEQSVRDLAYVRNYTIWEDIRILWQTARGLRAEHTAVPLARWQLADEHPSLIARSA